MPRRARRRPPVRRSLPPRPASAGAVHADVETPAPEAPRRAARLRAEAGFRRESMYVRRELFRIAGVTATCAGLLAILVAVDRLS